MNQLDQLPIYEADVFARAKVHLVEDCFKLLARNKLEVITFPRGRGVARLLNLLHWEASHNREYVDGDGPLADQVVHYAVHHVVDHHFPATHPHAMLCAECLASASDFYLLGNLLAAGEESDFLLDTIDSMTAFYEMYGDTADLEALLQNAADQPFATMVDVARFLFDASAPLLFLPDPEAQGAQLLGTMAHRCYCLLHHYNITNWILVIRTRFPHPPTQPFATEQLAVRFLTDEASFLANFRPA